MFIISLSGYDPELYLLAWIIIASVHLLRNDRSLTYDRSYQLPV